MNRKEQLLTILAEECAEVAKDCSKAKRFGLDSYYPGDPIKTPNKDRIVQEFHELVAVFEMLTDEKLLDDFDVFQAVTVKGVKRARVESYLNRSKELGTLTE